MKRGPSFKSKLIPAILNTTSDHKPINPAQPIKWQTRRIARPKFSPGDEIAILETFRLGQWYPNRPVIEVRYQAGDCGRWATLDDDLLKLIAGWKQPKRFKPGMFMPAAFSRMKARCIDIRYEPLCSISETDAIAEGISPLGNGFYRDYSLDLETPHHGLNPYESFKSLWDSIHGKGEFDENPSVWVAAWSLEAVVLCNRGTLLCA